MDYLKFQEDVGVEFKILTPMQETAVPPPQNLHWDKPYIRYESCVSVDGELMILSVPRSVAGQMAQAIAAGYPVRGNWRITRCGHGLQTRYKVQPLDEIKCSPAKKSMFSRIWRVFAGR
jgi:hypothetical protein